MIYYVSHPELEVTALVDAPSTEKARTAFLDYLERQGRVSRADRQYFRRDMIMHRTDSPEDFRADVELNYGYQEGPPSRVMARAPQIQETEPEQPVQQVQPQPPPQIVQQAPQPGMPIQRVFRAAGASAGPRTQLYRRSPIQQVAMGRRG